MNDKALRSYVKGLESIEARISKRLDKLDGEAGYEDEWDDLTTAVGRIVDAIEAIKNQLS